MYGICKKSMGTIYQDHGAKLIVMQIPVVKNYHYSPSRYCVLVFAHLVR